MRNPFFSLKQWAIRWVHQSRLGVRCYKCVSWIRVQIRRMFGRSKRQDSDRNFGLELAGSPSITERNALFDRYQSEFASMQGWFLTEAAAAWFCLLSFQSDQQTTGNFLEVGVWKGKSAVALAMCARKDEHCVFVDRMILPEFKQVISSIRKDDVLFVEQPSEQLLTNAVITDLRDRFRWIHIDGEHSGQAVRKDLEIAVQLLADKGVICVDDFPSNAYPQIHFAVIEYLVQNPSLVLFATGHNKGYICRRAAADEYLDYIRQRMHSEMTGLGVSVTIWKSGRPGDCQCFGITEKIEQYDYRGPDWNPSEIDG